MISELKRNLDLAQIVRESGVTLRSSGSRKVGRCPFHSEKTPSFYIFQDQHFKCFGCGISGDCIDFVRKYYGLTFPEALKHLGLESGRITPEVKRDIKRRKRRAELVREFKNWLNRYTAHIGSLIIETEALMRAGIPREDLELYASLLHGLPVWHYHLSILTEGSDKEKFELYKEARTWKTILT